MNLVADNFLTSKASLTQSYFNSVSQAVMRHLVRNGSRYIKKCDTFTFHFGSTGILLVIDFISQLEICSVKHGICPIAIFTPLDGNANVPQVVVFLL